jgi:hypothetical protein
VGRGRLGRGFSRRPGGGLFRGAGLEKLFMISGLILKAQYGFQSVRQVRPPGVPTGV